MNSLRQYLVEEASGNYVCVNAEDLSSFFKRVGIKEPGSGVAPPDYHCTLMYSTQSHIEPERILSALRASGFDKLHVAKIIGFDCFPDSETQDLCCLVAKLDCPALYQMNDMLKGMGMRHSFHEYTPHVTLRYKMSATEASKYMENLSSESLMISLRGFKSERINNNYV